MSRDRWAVEYTAAARRDLRRLDPPVRVRVLGTIGMLVDEEPTGDVRRLSGRDEYRLRVGDWRVRFRRDDPRRVIVVVRILPRGRAYDR